MSTTTKQNKHQLVSSEAELLQLIRQELQAATQKDLVVMAGHFMLFVNDQNGKHELVPGVIEEQETDVMRERISRRVGIFPNYTWQMGVQLAAEFHEKFDEKKFLLLINDWQYVPVKSEISASDLRKTFYEENFLKIPESYNEVLKASNLFTAEDNILSSRKHPVSFPETWLKYRFQKSAEKLVKAGKLEKRLLNDHSTDSEVTFLDESGNYRTLISCGVTGCAGEVTEMIAEVHKAGHRLMLVFAPGECFKPVTTGIEIALSLYGLTDMTLIVADPGGSGEMSKEEIYEKMVNFAVYHS